MVAVSCWCLRAVAAVSRGVAAVESWRRGGRAVARFKFVLAAVGAREQRAARCDGPQTLQCARRMRVGIVAYRCAAPRALSGINATALRL